MKNLVCLLTAVLLLAALVPAQAVDPQRRGRPNAESPQPKAEARSAEAEVVDARRDAESTTVAARDGSRRGRPNAESPQPKAEARSAEAEVGDARRDAESTTVAARDGSRRGRPNVVVILADDLGYGDLRCYNAEAKVATPHCDQLAKLGMRFVDAHSPATVCTPSRYGLLTGQMPFRVKNGGKVFQGVGGPSLIAGDRLTLPELLQARGYATACIGKWHLGLTFPDQDGKPVHSDDLEAVRRVDFSRPFTGGPLEHGFERFFGTACCPTTDWLYAFLDGDRVPVPPVALLDKAKLPKHVYANDCRPGVIAKDFPMQEVDLVFLERSREFLREHARRAPEQPFFLYHAMQAVHLPSFAAPQFAGKSKAGPHGDFLGEMDHVVGELMAQLQQLGLAENTVVVFTSDNGPETTSVVAMRADHGHDGARPWRGMKRDSWEGGHRVPFLVRWPGQVPAGAVSTQPICLTDVMATVASIVGAELPDDAAEDSFDLLPAWLGKATEPIRPYLLHQAFGGVRTLSIRRGNWKLLDHAGSGGNRYENDPRLRPFVLPDESGAAVQLYDLENDPGETKNLAAQRPELVRELTALLAETKAAGRSRPVAR